MHCSCGVWLAKEGVNIEVEVVAGWVVGSVNDGRIAKLLKNRPGPGGVLVEGCLRDAAWFPKKLVVVVLTFDPQKLEGVSPNLPAVKRPAVCVVVVVVGTAGVCPAADPAPMLGVAVVPPAANRGVAVPPPTTAVVVDGRVKVPPAFAPEISPVNGALAPTAGTAVVVTAAEVPFVQVGMVVVVEEEVTAAPTATVEVAVVIVVVEGAAVVPDAAAGVTRAATVADDVPWPIKANAGVVAMGVDVVL